MIVFDEYVIHRSQSYPFTDTALLNLECQCSIMESFKAHWFSSFRATYFHYFSAFTIISFVKLLRKVKLKEYEVTFSSVQFSHSVVSDSLQPHGLQCQGSLSITSSPKVYSNSYPLNWWCHTTISTSVVPFSSHLQSFPI